MTNQFPDATKMVLSPAAQAVLDALCMEELNGPQQLMARAYAAAALRAVAVRINGADAIRQDILDIADELEALPND